MKTLRLQARVTQERQSVRTEASRLGSPDDRFAAMNENGFAVIATSLSIAAVFVPAAFMEGLVGQFFYEFGMTVAFAVIVSTLIALFLSTMLCAKILKRKSVAERAKRFGNVSDVSDGDVSDGDVSDGDVSDGDVSDGDVSDGDVSHGDVLHGDVSDSDEPKALAASATGLLGRPGHSAGRLR